MIEPIIMSLMADEGIASYIGFVPEKKTLPAVTVETLNLTSQKMIKNYNTKIRKTNISLNVFGNTITETKLLQSKVLRLFESLDGSVEYLGYKYTMRISVVNAVDMFVMGTNKAIIDIHVEYQEHKL
ncbi:hypothetical protein [Aeromonas sobria]|uniref:hypothetical protein n=1 Tax=Aeromonas sobria TaxID=646 RepID=UPI000C6EB14F|nr:hypothetical protein [Aeromonas sobria]PKQ78087.1 hypothetical protein CJF47_07345 [Aeromonas sobria]